MLIGSTNSLTPCDSKTWSPAPCAVFFDHQPVLEARAAAALHEHAQAAAGFVLFGQKLVDLRGRRFGYVNHQRFLLSDSRIIPLGSHALRRASPRARAESRLAIGRPPAGTRSCWPGPIWRRPSTCSASCSAWSIDLDRRARTGPSAPAVAAAALPGRQARARHPALAGEPIPLPVGRAQAGPAAALRRAGRRRRRRGGRPHPRRDRRRHASKPVRC